MDPTGRSTPVFTPQSVCPESVATGRFSGRQTIILFFLLQGQGTENLLTQPRSMARPLSCIVF